MMVASEKKNQNRFKNAWKHLKIIKKTDRKNFTKRRSDSPLDLSNSDTA